MALDVFVGESAEVDLWTLAYSLVDTLSLTAETPQTLARAVLRVFCSVVPEVPEGIFSRELEDFCREAWEARQSVHRPV